MDTVLNSASSAVTSIAPDALYQVLGGPHCPLIIDVRKAAAFDGDHAMLAQGIAVYDALYAWCRHARDEHHNWTPVSVAAA